MGSLIAQQLFWVLLNHLFNVREGGPVLQKRRGRHFLFPGVRFAEIPLLYKESFLNLRPHSHLSLIPHPLDDGVQFHGHEVREEGRDERARAHHGAVYQREARGDSEKGARRYVLVCVVVGLSL